LLWVRDDGARSVRPYLEAVGRVCQIDVRACQRPIHDGASRLKRNPYLYRHSKFDAKTAAKVTGSLLVLASLGSRN
jgi:hypothetical protein